MFLTQSLSELVVWVREHDLHRLGDLHWFAWIVHFVHRKDRQVHATFRLAVRRIGG